MWLSFVPRYLDNSYWRATDVYTETTNPTNRYVVAVIKDDTSQDICIKKYRRFVHFSCKEVDLYNAQCQAHDSVQHKEDWKSHVNCSPWVNCKTVTN